jgi:hypothetical protein
MHLAPRQRNPRPVEQALTQQVMMVPPLRLQVAQPPTRTARRVEIDPPRFCRRAARV